MLLVAVVNENSVLAVLLFLVQVRAASPVPTKKTLCAADECASVLQLDILDNKRSIWQDLKSLSPRVDGHHSSLEKDKQQKTAAMRKKELPM